MIHLKKTLAAVLCSVAVLVLSPSAPAQQRGNRERDLPATRDNPQFLQAFRTATAEASRSTVRVLCDGKDAALGTIIGPDGWILTKASLLSGKVACKLKDGRALEARIVGVHETFDLAMLKIEATDLPSVRFADSKVAPVGNWLVSVGPGEDPVAVGVMSVATRTPPPVPNRPPVARPSPSVNLLVPMSAVRPLGVLAAPLGQGPLLAAAGLFPRRNLGFGPGGMLGISVVADGKAVRVTDVAPRSAAARAGLKVDDRILSIQGNAITNEDALRAVLGRMRPGDVVAIKLVRAGKDMDLKATLQARRQFRRPDQNLMGSELSQRRTGFPTYFQSDTVIKPKDCGGPVCDLDGHVIGINIARAGRVESYSIPTEALTPLLADLMSGQLSPRRLEIGALEKKIAALRTSLKSAETEKSAADRRLQEAQAALKKQEADRSAADRRWKETKDALEKAERDLKEKK